MNCIISFMLIYKLFGENNVQLDYLIFVTAGDYRNNNNNNQVFPVQPSGLGLRLTSLLGFRVLCKPMSLTSED